MDYLISTKSYQQYQLTVAQLLEDCKIESPEEAIFIPLHPPSRKQRMNGLRGFSQDHLLGTFSAEEVFLLTLHNDPKQAVIETMNKIAHAEKRLNTSLKHNRELHRLLPFMQKQLQKDMKKYVKSIDDDPISIATPVKSEPNSPK